MEKLVSPGQLKRARKQFRQIKGTVKKLKRNAIANRNAIKLFYPHASLPPSLSRHSSDDESYSSSSTESEPRRSPMRREKGEMGAASTGKTKLANNLTSWWSKFKKRLSDEQVRILYNEFEFQKGERMTEELQAAIRNYAKNHF